MNSKLWDLFGVAVCGWGVYQCFFALPLPEHLSKGTNFQFLTSTGVFCLFVYAGLNLNGINLTWLHYLVGSLEFQITVAYWYYRWFNPQLINSDYYKPSLLDDLLYHGLPYLYIIGKRVPMISFKNNAVISGAGLLVYIVYVEYLVHVRGAIYPYPVLRNASQLGLFTHYLTYYIVGLGNQAVEYLLR